MWKDFFYFSRTERQGILILTILITLVCTISWFMPARDTEIKDNPESEKEYETFITSIKKRENRIDFFRSQHCRFQYISKSRAPFMDGRQYPPLPGKRREFP